MDAKCQRVGWGTQRPRGRASPEDPTVLRAGVKMDPGGYSKRGLSDLLSDLLSQTIDVQPPPTFLVQDLRTFPSHFSIAGVWRCLGVLASRRPLSQCLTALVTVRRVRLVIVVGLGIVVIMVLRVITVGRIVVIEVMPSRSSS